MMTIEEQIKAVAQQQRLGVYFSNTERNHGRPWIILKHRGLTLAEFRDPDSALRWFPKSVVPTGQTRPFLKESHHE